MNCQYIENTRSKIHWKDEEDEDGVKKFLQARGRGGKEAGEKEKEVQTNQELTVGLGKGKIKGRKITIFN